MRFEVENILKEDTVGKKHGQLLLQMGPKDNDYQENPNNHFRSEQIRSVQVIKPQNDGRATSPASQPWVLQKVRQCTQGLTILPKSQSMRCPK